MTHHTLSTTRITYRDHTQQTHALQLVGSFDRQMMLRQMRREIQNKIDTLYSVLNAPDADYTVEHTDQSGFTTVLPHMPARMTPQQLQQQPQPHQGGLITNGGTTTANQLYGSGAINLIQVPTFTAPLGGITFGNASEYSEGYTPLLVEEDMRENGFTDHREGYWYKSWPLNDNGDITLNLSIKKDNGEYDVEVLDEEFGQPYHYGTHRPPYLSQIVERINEALQDLRDLRIHVNFNHAEYGYEQKDKDNDQPE